MYPQIPQDAAQSAPVANSQAKADSKTSQIGMAPGSSSQEAGAELTSTRSSQKGTNIGQATNKAGAYGGSEIGSRIGGMVGPPIIGSIVGNLVGEKVGEAAVKETGLEKKVAKAGDELSSVIGKKNVDKIGDITMTALGYSSQEECVCCPCLPASQVLLVLTVPFFVFNCYKLGVGIEYEASCTLGANLTETSQNSSSNSTIFPCEYGFHYLVVSGAVWVSFLPFWILSLFGNCWRQCCCCCCDPVVLGTTVVDFIKRCCCECGRFNCCEFVWYSMCLFHIVWSLSVVRWISDSAFGDSFLNEVWRVVIASVVLDFLFAGSEIFHRVRLHQKRKEAQYEVNTNEQGQNLNLQTSAGQPVD